MREVERLAVKWRGRLRSLSLSRARRRALFLGRRELNRRRHRIKLRDQLLSRSLLTIIAYQCSPRRGKRIGRHENRIVKRAAAGRQVYFRRRQSYIEFATLRAVLCRLPSQRSFSPFELAGACR